MGYWREIGGDWRAGDKWRNTLGVLVTDPGANLPIAYHHGAGFRDRAARVDTMLGGFSPEMHKPKNANSSVPGLRRLQRHFRSRRRARRRAKWEREEEPRRRALADEVFRAIVADEDIVERFRPRAGASESDGAHRS